MQGLVTWSFSEKIGQQFFIPISLYYFKIPVCDIVWHMAFRLMYLYGGNLVWIIMGEKSSIIELCLLIHQTYLGAIVIFQLWRWFWLNLDKCA